MLGIDIIEAARTEITSIRRQNDIENSWRTHHYFVDFESRIDVVISTWIRLSKWMKSRRTFHGNFRTVDGKSMVNPRRCVHLETPRFPYCPVIVNVRERNPDRKE